MSPRVSTGSSLLGLLVACVGLRIFANWLEFRIFAAAVGALGLCFGLSTAAWSMSRVREVTLRSWLRTLTLHHALACLSLAMAVLCSFVRVPAEPPRWWTLLCVTWPGAALAASIALVLLTWGLRDGPTRTLLQGSGGGDTADQPRLPPLLPSRARVLRQAAWVCAIALVLPFPVNYVARRHATSWDFAYLRAPEPGPGTTELAQELRGSLKLYLFFEPASEVARLVRPYFATLSKRVGGLELEWVDHAVAPKLARRLGVAQNGVIALERLGSEGLGTTRTWKVGDTPSRAQRRIPVIDAEIYRRLQELAGGERRIYLLQGHGELGTRGDDRQANTGSRSLREIAKIMQVELVEHGLAAGTGQELPPDADALAILGARQPLSRAQAQAAIDLFERGGALVIAVEPIEEYVVAEVSGAVRGPVDHLDQLLAHLGVVREPGVLASERNHAVVGHGPADRANIVSNRFSAHAATAAIAAIEPSPALYLSKSAVLRAGGEEGVTAIVRSLSDNWADLDGNYELGPGESRGERPLALAIERSGAGRALVLADSNMWADRFIAHPANLRFVHDSLRWALGQSELLGGISDERDVRIEHTKEGETLWFYGPVWLVPLAVGGLGTWYVRRRRRRVEP